MLVKHQIPFIIVEGGIMVKEYKRIESQLIHAGDPDKRIDGSVVMPIFQSAMFQYAGEKGYDQIRYIRLNNTPNQVVLHRKLAVLENAEAALVTASGMAAITTTLLTVLSSGDHLLAQDCLYGGTHDFLTKDFRDFGLSYDFINADDPESWKRLLRPATKAIYVETMTNPLLQVADLKAIVQFAREHGLVSIIDSTFASPVNFRPPEWGFDLSLHSATKYLNGHSDIVAGVVIGKASWVERITHRLNHLGGSLDPHAAFLLHRGMKTLAVRMRQHNESALRLAQFLEQHPAVATVNYPGLKSHPRHARARELFEGFSGVLSFEPKGGLGAAEQIMTSLRVPVVAPSLGSVETLVTRPATTSHSGMAPEDRRRLGISDSLIRVSIGLEATEDLIEDFNQALEKTAAGRPLAAHVAP
jgi:cystathionine beta-lyase/cystathionine gamma-synthase